MGKNEIERTDKQVDWGTHELRNYRAGNLELYKGVHPQITGDSGEH